MNKRSRPVIRRAGTFLSFRQNGTAHLSELTCAIDNLLLPQQMLRTSYEIQSELHIENELKNAIIQVTEGTINAETEDDLMAAEAMAQKTDVSIHKLDLEL